MMQSEKQLTVYTSRRLSLQRRNELNSKVSCSKGRNTVNSYPNKMVTVKRKFEENSSKKVKRGRKKKTKRKSVECDEVTRLQNRARYLLIKIKLERNLIEAYSTDGWKGQSREKIRPEKELQRAEKEIVRCKLGIREIMHQFDTLISSCNCGNNHQISLETPFETNCKYCENKIKILEAINAHLCTSFSLNSSYEDIFEEATDNRDYENKNEEEWASDESEDEDYSPSESDNNIEEFDFIDSDWSTDPIHNTTNSINNTDKSDLNEGDLDNNCEIIHQRRKRINVDYRKLHDEMFGKDAVNEEESSEDEEWGPRERKNIRRKESTPDNQVINSKSDENGDVDLFTSGKHNKIQTSNMSIQVKELIAKRNYSRRNVNGSKLHNNPDVILKSKEKADCESDKAALQENICFDLLEKMFVLQNRVHSLKKALVLYSNCAAQENMSQDQERVLFVPFAQLIQKT